MILFLYLTGALSCAVLAAGAVTFSACGRLRLRTIALLTAASLICTAPTVYGIAYSICEQPAGYLGCLQQAGPVLLAVLLAVFSAFFAVVLRWLWNSAHVLAQRRWSPAAVWQGLLRFYRADSRQRPDIARRIRRRAPGQLFRTAVVLVAAVTLCEVYVLNFRHFQPKALQQYTLSPVQFQEVVGLIRQEDGSYRAEEGADLAELQITGIDMPVASIFVELGGFSHMLDVHFGFTDDAHRYDERWVGQYVMSPTVRRSCFAPVISNGSMHELTIRFQGELDGLEVRGVRLNFSPAFTFYYGRWAVLCLAAVTILLVVRLRLWRVPLQRGEIHQALCFFAVIVLGVAFCTWTLYTSVEPAGSRYESRFTVSYPMPDGDYSDAYLQQTDAFIKGQIELDVPDMAGQLEGLEDPYDETVRWQSGKPYLFDRAYYQGRYYSYFGAAPVVTFFLPFYLVTGRLPTSLLASFFFASVFVVFAVLAVKEMAARLLPRPNFLLTLIGSASVVCASTVFYDQRAGSFYYVAQLAAMAFCALFLYLAFVAIRTERCNCLLLALAGVAYVLTVQSRPSFIPYLFAVVPVFCSVLARGTLTVRRRAVCAACFVLPVVLGAGFTMWYNFVRFGSVFEFGARYQLTLNNIQYNTPTHLIGALPAIFHYLLQLPSFTLSYPFFRVSGVAQQLMENYYFNWGTVGAFAYPAVTAAAFTPLCLRRLFPQNTARHTVAILFGTALLVAYLDFSMAGIVYRYSSDILLPLSLVALSIMQAWCTRRSGRYRPAAVGICVVLMLITIFMGLMLSLDAEYWHLLGTHPEDYLGLRFVLEFWR